MFNHLKFNDLSLQLKKKGMNKMLDPHNTDFSQVGTRIADSMLKEVSGGKIIAYVQFIKNFW